MSVYEMLDYDEMQRRIGIEPGEPWYCGGNPANDASYEEVGATYDDIFAYTGRSPKLVGGLCLTEDINVNGLLLNHRDNNNTIWLCTNIEGWWTLPPSEIPDVPRPYWDGSMLTTGRYLARTITISGVFMPPHPSLVWYNRDALLRVSSAVRGVGLLAMCGNEDPVISHATTPDHPFLDPPKMTLIQTNDVPLIETVKANGFTQFELSFRCVNPTKISVYEKQKTIPVENDDIVRKRRYKAISQPASAGGQTTEYAEVLRVEDSAAKRHYSELKEVNLDALIEDEEFTELNPPTRPPGMSDAAYQRLVDAYVDQYYDSKTSLKTIVLHNAGNYFASPTFVFAEITGATPDALLTVRNLTTEETLQIQRSVTEGRQLVIDTGMRRVGEVDPETSAVSWKWDDRNYMTLASQWITLAPGDNTIIVSRPTGQGVKVPTLPRVYWRDTWIG